MDFSEQLKSLSNLRGFKNLGGFNVQYKPESRDCLVILPRNDVFCNYCHLEPKPFFSVERERSYLIDERFLTPTFREAGSLRSVRNDVNEFRIGCQ